VLFVLSLLVGLAPQLPSPVPNTGSALRAFIESGPGYVPPEGIPEPHSAYIGGPTWSRGWPVPGYPGIYNIELHNTGSGYVEKFLFAPAPVSFGHPAPALVVFHGYSTSHFDALLHTDLWREARARGWHFIAPLGAFANNFGCLEGQINTQAVLDYLVPLYPIDTQRIFGVGFSMGGGALLSQAARHNAADGLRFSALVDHTGSVALLDVYNNSSASVRSLIESHFGGNPTQYPFRYAQCSTIDLAPGPLPHLDMALNLSATPTLLWMATQEPNAYLQGDMYKLRDELLAEGAPMHLVLVAGNQHSWSTLDDHAVCDWLALQAPLPAHRLHGSVLADVGGNWFGFDLVQSAAGSFTPWRWDSHPASNELDLSESSNLLRLQFDARDFGLAYTGDLVLSVSTADGTGDELVIEGIQLGTPPQTVQRNGVQVTFSYDPQTGRLSLPAAGATPDVWRIHF